MMDLNQLLKPLQRVPNSVAIFIFVIALVGFVDAAYLTVEHYQGEVPPCSVTEGCETVLTSSYSSVLGIPVALGGAIYYFLVLVGAFGYLESKKISFLKWALILTIPGFIASMWFVYIQVFALDSYCAYCLLSALTSTILFVTAMDILPRYRLVSGK